MKKASCLLLCLSVLPGAIYAEQTDSCAGLEGAGLTQCRSNQQTLRQQERLEQQLQQQEERQNQLAKEQRDVQQQLEDMRRQNEMLRKQLERETTNPAGQPVAAKTTSLEVKSWRADNPWFGSDYARTQFAVRYITQLQQARPDLTGRELLDALSLKVNETFGAKQ